MATDYLDTLTNYLVRLSRLNCTRFPWLGDNLAAVYTAEEILEIVGGRLASGMTPGEAGEICPDTRKLKEGDWFIALPGRHFDGHDFLGDAFAGGALGAIVEERGGYAIASNSFPLLAVSNTNEACFRLARNWRRRIGPKVILLCGEKGELNLLVNLVRQCAQLQEMQSVTLPECQVAKEACQLILAMPDDTKLLVVGLNPLSADEVAHCGEGLEPNVLAFMPLALANLRLTTTPKRLASARISLVNNLNKGSAWLLVCEAEIDQTSLETVNSYATVLKAPAPFFDSEKWQAKGPAPHLKESYQAVVTALSETFSPEAAWTCANVCALVGIDLTLVKEICLSLD